MPPITEVSGTITPLVGSCKVGLDDSNPPIVSAVPKNAVAKWLVQAVDDAPDCYRLFVNDGKKDYALSASEERAVIATFEAAPGSPASSDSRLWLIVELPNEYYYIQDIATQGAWHLSGNEIELAPLPVEKDELKTFKFRFTFS